MVDDGKGFAIWQESERSGQPSANHSDQPKEYIHDNSFITGGIVMAVAHVKDVLLDSIVSGLRTR
ncbi:hypothetical protein [Candidatus Regiella insecticola]|uniref:hypothetical protein n=1 Tax=Candidatus Regiella insecticola TaxID=138073 RepID=UPI001145D0B8|nr:hypothetical protein [Candidatus Regiella insecticola]